MLERDKMEQTRIELRPFTWEDLSGLVALINAAGEVDGTDERYTEETLREEIEAFADPLLDCTLAVTADERIVGYAFCERRDDEQRVWGYGWGTVRPDFRRQGIGTRLLRAADSRFASWVEHEVEVGDRAVFIQRFINRAVAGEIALAQAEGYDYLRSSYRMSIDLRQSCEPPVLPEGFDLRPFVAERDALAVYTADRDAFLDGGGLDRFPPFEQWCETHIRRPAFDPALWLVAVVGDRVAGVCFSAPWGADHPELAWITHLAVSRAFRGRGLGSALLRGSFYACQRAGFERAALGVRADNPGALAIYERVGMTIYSTFDHYRTVLHGDPAQIRS
ncbi:MAG: GNAT family N-acetyltransferase [Anaerolineae bacterium]|nr:GNAT family N-acetyltransferase [Anaerolineae bacterium]